MQTASETLAKPEMVHLLYRLNKLKLLKMKYFETCRTKNMLVDNGLFVIFINWLDYRKIT